MGSIHIQSPQHFVLTGVWNLPFGKTILVGSCLERAILGVLVLQYLPGIIRLSVGYHCDSLPDKPGADHV